MKHLINRLICLCSGHKWKEHWRRKYIDPFNLDDAIPRAVAYTCCKRCGKILKEQP